MSARPQDASLSLLGTLHKFLAVQYDQMDDQLPGMLGRADPDCVHDSRVALRRFRAILKLYHLAAPDDNLRPLDSQVSDLVRRLSHVRDEQVDAKWLVRGRLRVAIEAAPGGRQWLLEQIQAQPRWQADLATVIQSPETEACLQGMLLCASLPEAIRDGENPSVKKRLLKKLRRLPGQIQSCIHPDLFLDGEAMHKLRKRCRRGRYFSEFGAPLMGKQEEGVMRIAARLKEQASALGELRDLDRVRDKLFQAGFLVPDAEEFLLLRRQKELKKAHAALKKLQDKDLAKF